MIYFMLIIAFVIIFIGVIMVTISSSFYKNSKLGELKSNGDMLISCLKKNYDHRYGFSSDGVSSLYTGLSDEYDLNICLYDREGNCILSAYDFADSEDKEDYTPTAEIAPLSEKVISETNKKEYLDFDSSSISNSAPRTLYRTKFIIMDNGEPLPDKFYLSIYGKSDKVNSFTIKISLLYVLFAALAIFLCYMLIERRIKRLDAYENEFEKTVELYAKGNFDEKLKTDVPGVNKDIAEYVNTLASNVEKSEETSKTFIANVSHELRTPITTVGGFVDGILDGTISKSRQNEYLVLVSKEIKRLKILITSMLNMSRFENGTMSPNFKMTNMTDLVIQTVLMFEKKIDDKNLEVEGLGSERIDAEVDADLMQQVVYNLVENAVKFVNNGGTLSFRFEINDGICTVGIRNTGEGLKNEEIAQVFDRFYKTDSSRGKDTTGLGLGLSISRKIVHLHDGHIVVKSVYGEYTEFLIQIPEKRSAKKKSRNSEKG